MISAIHTPPFYRPLWRRLTIIAMTALWAGIEMFTGHDVMWQVVAGAFLVFSVWAMLVTYPKGQ